MAILNAKREAKFPVDPQFSIVVTSLYVSSAQISVIISAIPPWRCMLVSRLAGTEFAAVHVLDGLLEFLKYCIKALP
jgi:hypothetical protein